MKRILALLGALAIGAGALWFFFRPPSGGVAIAELAKHAPVTDPQALSSKQIGQDDLPPEGTRSLFDHLVAQADGVPYPFEKLVALIQKQDPAGKPPLSLLIPDGRSLLKAQADNGHPRVLVAADFQSPGSAASLGLAPRGQLFIGFTELANEIEVISYNEKAGRFEFQLVQDYRANGSRKLVYAKRAICGSCHQGHAPIFSQRPWNETNGQPETARAILDARCGEAASPGCDQYLGMPLAQPLSSPERYDELTDIGNFVTAAQKLWIDQCGAGVEGAACRRQMLKLALDYVREPGEFKADSAAAKELLKQQQVSGAKPIAVPESDLPNRDPIGERKGIKGFFRTLFKPRIKLGDGARTNEDLEAFDKLPKLPAHEDPLTPRAPKRVLGAQDIDGVYGLASLFAPSDVDRLLSATGQDWTRVQQAIDALPDDFFAPRPFSRVTALQALLAPGVLLASTATVPGYCCLDTSELSPPVASGEPPVVLAAQSPLKPFSQYCFACHRGNPSKRLNFMAGATESEVLEHVKAKSEIRDVLDWTRYAGTDKANKLMPPADSAQHAALAEAVKTNPKLLDDMRAVVPGLFDF